MARKVGNGVGDIKLPSQWRQWPGSPQPLPSGPLLTFMGVGSPQLHHGQVAGGGGAEGEVRGQGYRAPLRRGRGPHPVGHKAAQEGLACREKGGGSLSGRWQSRLCHLDYHPKVPLPPPPYCVQPSVPDSSKGILWPAPTTPRGPNHHGDQGRQPDFPALSENDFNHPGCRQKPVGKKGGVEGVPKDRPGPLSKGHWRRRSS